MNKQVYRTQLRFKRRAGSVAGGIVTGLATMLNLSTPAHSTYRYRCESVNKSLRGDMVRLGGDMRKAVKKERQREETRR